MLKLLLIASTAALVLGGLLVIVAGVAGDVGAMAEWIRTKHACAWCRKWLSGNPFSKRVSHDICPRCREAMGCGEEKP